MDKGNVHLHDLIRYFDTYNRSDGKSLPTLCWYNGALMMFLGWLTETGRSVTLGSIDETTVREFILWLHERRVYSHKISVPTVNKRVRALRAFFNWLYSKGYTGANILKDVKQPRLP